MAREAREGGDPDSTRFYSRIVANEKASLIFQHKVRRNLSLFDARVPVKPSFRLGFEYLIVGSNPTEQNFRFFFSFLLQNRTFF